MATSKKPSLLRSVRWLVSTLEKNSHLKYRRFHQEEVIDQLLLCDIDTINDFLDEQTLQIAERNMGVLKKISACSLYCIIFDQEKDFGSCVLGSDILTPDFLIPTQDQLIKAFEWHSTHNTCESKFSKSVDDWVEFQLRFSFERLTNYRKILMGEIITWRDMFLDERRVVQSELLTYHHFLLKGLRKEVSALKKRAAPEFMLQEYSEKIRRMKDIIAKLGDPVPY
jgi:hypothetical protein